MDDREEEFLGELRFGRRITSISRAVVGGLVLAPAITLILAGKSLGLAGSQSAIAMLLMIAVLGLSLLNIIELLGGSSERGGTTSLIHESLGDYGGFLAGWSLFAGSLALTVAFGRSIGEELLYIFPQLPLNAGLLGLGVGMLLILVQVFRFLPGRGWAYPATVLILVVVVVLLLTTFPAIKGGSVRPEVPDRTGNLMRVAAWMVIIFITLESALANRRQIQDPVRRLPSILTIILVSGALLILVGQLFAIGISGHLPLGAELPMAKAILEASTLPSWVVVGAIVFLLLAGANSGLMTAARQLYDLSRWGALPRQLRAVRGPFKLPPLIFGVLAALLIPAALLASADQLLNLTAAFYLVAVILLNLGYIRSYLTEPDRRKTFVVPFFPLSPAIAIALSGAMLLVLPPVGLLWGLGWLVLGVLVYEAYSRSHVVEAREGILVFGPSPEHEKKEGMYRILVPVSAGVERRMVLELATAFARQMGGELIALQVLTIPDPLAMEQGQRLARERNTLFQWSIRFASRTGVPIYPVTRLARSVHEGILETAAEEKCDLIMLSWAIEPEVRGGGLGRVLDPVIRRAPCDVVVLGFHPQVQQEVEMERGALDGKSDEGNVMAMPIERILVTTAGGPHAPLASRLAVLLAREYGATTRGVYVADPDSSEEQIKLGQARIQKTLEAMRRQASELLWGDFLESLEEDLPFESQVITADTVIDGIVQAGEESDLVLLGASEESLIDQVIFGTLPEAVARASKTPVLMVKRYQGLPRFWLQRLWDAIAGAFPSVSAEDRLDVYRRVRRSARPDVDFFVMIGLSAIIASYGLLQDSSAVIIGGMLVAPLFTPILALSLAIVQGDIRLLRLAVEATVKGVVLAIGVAILLTVISPLHNLTEEVLARVSPGLFDLAVALASGAAGAYAIARKDVAAALPGVAIAAALVPPLCVVGIGLAGGDMQVAGGGGLLFLTNLVAIVLAGSIALLLLGFRPTERGEREAHLRKGLVASLILLILISVPLAVVFSRSTKTASLHRRINQALMEETASNDQLELLDFEFVEEEEQVLLTVHFYAQTTPTASFVMDLSQRLSDVLDQPVLLDVVSIPVTKLESTDP